MIVIRRVGALLLVAAAIAVYFVLAPKKAHVTTPIAHNGQLSAIASDYTANENTAQYIYQQIYDTGVATKDTVALLVRQADQQAADAASSERSIATAEADPRIPAELVLLIVAGALFLATSSRVAARGPNTDGGAPAAPPLPPRPVPPATIEGDAGSLPSV